jgi:hypothetical protein
MTEMRLRCERFEALVPPAFAPPNAKVRACVAALGRNYAASMLPAGTPLRVEPEDAMPFASAGSDSHGDTTYAAIESVFAFLTAGAAGEAAAANASLRRQHAAAAAAAAGEAAGVSGPAGTKQPLPVAEDAAGKLSDGGRQPRMKRALERVCAGSMDCAVS